jgi:hypothetical protein
MNGDDYRRAQRECERRGFTGSDLSACIYDNGFLRIEPTPKPNIPNRTAGRPLDPVRTPAPNVNPGQKPYRERYPEPRTSGTPGGNTGNNGVPRDEKTSGGSERTIVDKDASRSATGKDPEVTRGNGPSTSTRPVVREGSSGTAPETTEKPAETVNPRVYNSGSSSTTTQPVKTPEPEVTRPVYNKPVYTEPVRTEPVKTEPVRTEPVRTQPIKVEPRYTPPPSNPVSTPTQRPASTPVSTPVSTPSKPISTPIRRGG